MGGMGFSRFAGVLLNRPEECIHRENIVVKPVDQIAGGAVAVRLKDIAAHAGVSVKTVSNVVRGHPGVSRPMRLRVQNSIDTLGYWPNVTARSLRSGRTGLIGLALPRLHDAYFAELAAGIVSCAADRGWTVLIEQTNGEAVRETEVLTGHRPAFVDGLIFSPISVSSQVLAGASPTVPIVLLGEHLQAAPRTRVSVDNVAAARDAVTHLLEGGRRLIAAVGVKTGQNATTAQLRLQGYQQALDSAGLSVPPEYQLAVQHLQRTDGAGAARAALALTPRPDALFCFNDLLALGALRALRDAGVRVPQDIAVVGFDDIEEALFSVPRLTSIGPDKTRLAAAAVEQLAALLGEPAAAGGAMVQVPHRLSVRDSSEPAGYASADDIAYDTDCFDLQHSVHP
jgi:DNA-binding LacI/PurR family transcriptional regulator